MRLTEPDRQVLPSDFGFGQEDVDELLGQFGNAVQETMHYGTKVLKWTIHSEDAKPDMVAILLLRNVLELLDAISLLIRNSSIDPCKPLLRSMVESIWQAEHLLTDDTELKAKCFLVWQCRKELRLLNRLHSASGGNEAVRGVWEECVRRDGQRRSEELATRKAHLESVLQEDRNRAVAQEYARTKKKHGSHPNWFSLFNGPRSIRELAVHLGHESDYGILYKNWSGFAHGTSIAKGKVSVNDDGTYNVVQLRYPEDAQFVAFFAMSLGIKFLRTIVKEYVPSRSREIGRWYVTKMRSEVQRTGGERILTAT